MPMRSRTLIALVVGAVLGFTGALAGNAFAQRQAAAPAAAPADALPWADAQLLAEVYERIKRDYVDTESDHKLFEDAVRGMVSGLDPHSAYLDRNQFAQMRVSTRGSYPGVGIEVKAVDSAVKIMRPIPGSPAQKAGLRAGDLIRKIDGVAVGADAKGAIERLRGAAGTSVRLSVLRPSTHQRLDFELRRATVDVHSVAERRLRSGYGYVRITQFTETTPEDVKQAIAKLQHGNPPGLKGLVLDLRNNPGGVLESGVAVADDFLDSGVIVSADGRTPDARFSMSAKPGDLLDGAPLVVLVNKGTASAAEILAGALRDHGRAELIGQRTYGKGTIQTVMPLTQGALKLTTSRYFLPSGASIQGKGILPDILAKDHKPAALGGGNSRPLAARDPEIRLALKTLAAQARSARSDRAVTAALTPAP